jgi:hypothetical protein
VGRQWRDVLRERGVRVRIRGSCDSGRGAYVGDWQRVELSGERDESIWPG